MVDKKRRDRLLPIPVVCAVVEQGGRLLAAQRGASMSHAGQWELPGGKVHDGESGPEALRREMMEEFRVAVDVGELLGAHVHDYGTFAIELCAYSCALDAGGLVCVEHECVKWLAPAEALSVDWTPADVPIVMHWQAQHRQRPALR